MGRRQTKEPKVQPEDRIDKFPDNSLVVSNGKLLCQACSHGGMSLRKGSIRTHVTSNMHKQNLHVWNAKLLREQTHLNVSDTPA